MKGRKRGSTSGVNVVWETDNVGTDGVEDREGTLKIISKESAASWEKSAIASPTVKRRRKQKSRVETFKVTEENKPESGEVKLKGYPLKIWTDIRKM